VDAALDDANVDRLSAMIRELSNDSQMLIVTHNKKTMELASRMYGVTMQEPGVSSIISAELNTNERSEPAREEALVAG
jgi:chromosome segregation protein